MKMVELYNSYYPFRDYCCINKNEEPIPKEIKTNLYIRVNNICNGKCKFCLNCNNKTTNNLNIEKLKEVYKYLLDKNMIKLVTITGGEPMLNPKYINDIINALVEINKDVEISISTNGTNLDKVLEFDNINNIKYIHVSRHHYIDEINDKIFGFKTISTNKIKEIQEKTRKIIINTVGIKNYIDNKEELLKMCDYTRKLDVNRLHYVSLINYNNYCKENYVDINNIFKELEEEKEIKRLDDLYRENYCECHYFELKDIPNKDFIIMGRLTHHNTCPYVEQLVYTNNNELITGFDSKTVINKNNEVIL